MDTLYIHEENIHNFTAPREVVPIVMSITKPKSVIDVGCGTGTWLKVFEEYGVTDYLGVDGDFVNRDLLKILNHNFYPHDLAKELILNRKYDLAISLEVAEHLPEEFADLFVKTLVLHSEMILFSAAIPGQGGQNHLNEQWPDYWIEKFSKHGYFFHDVIRPLIWNNKKVDYWYKQNTFLITKKRSENKIERYIHPDLFKSKVQEIEDMKRLISDGRLGAIKNLEILLKSVIRTISK